MPWRRLVVLVVALAAVAFAATASLAPAAADGIACGSVVASRVSAIQDTIDSDDQLAPELNEDPRRLTAGARAALHGCQETLSRRRVESLALGASGVALLVGLAVVPAVLRRRERR